MSKRVNVDLAKIVLSELLTQDLGYTRLCKKALIHCGTPASFRSILAYLKTQSFVEKAGPEHRAPYRITERGRQFMEAFGQ